ncbi:alginate lyase-domain-containing protein [Abortiporus biennis]|nr:alginate lyase-domain-containing protein [Abortiporus biennis]
MPSHRSTSLFLTLATYVLLGLAGGPNDWVNINYVTSMSKAGSSSSDTSSAQKAIISQAGITAAKGPWSITTTNVKPPSGDSHDYLSWAPYHWPDCNWCTKGANHIANPNSTDDFQSDPSSGNDPDQDPYDENTINNDLTNGNSFPPIRRRSFRSHSRIRRMHRSSLQEDSSFPSASIPQRRASTEDVALPVDDTPSLPPTPALPGTATTTRDKGVAGTQAPAQAPAKTQQSSKCTPSPTKTLAPSATWTTCPYVVRDGQVNPDVRTLPGPSSAQNMAESVFLNSAAFALQKSPTHSKNAAQFIDTFFLSPSTGMHPNMNFGQLVRGPGKEHQVGTFTGILDMRGLVKVVNAIQLLRISKSPDWTPSRDQAMTTWMKSYLSWLQNSSLGKEVASKANNHLTFYAGQLAAVQIFVGDNNGASTTLRNYFQKQFLDQVAASGEQPFEAVRTRPFHYRCFNLEAMITNAKLADQLGIDMWTAKSRYGANIQKALDYAMAQDPKGEDIADIFPHVASIAAAYGDPNDKYKRFLQDKMPNYKSSPFWFYDQSPALPNSPGFSKQKRSMVADDLVPATANLIGTSPGDVAANSGNFIAAQAKDARIPFQCPSVFQDSPETELEDGLFVTCEGVRLFYRDIADNLP